MKMKKIFSLTLMAIALALLPVGVWAQQPEQFRHGYGYDMMGWGGGWHGMIFGPLFIIVVLIVVIVLVVLLVRWLSAIGQGAHQPHHHMQSGQSARTPIDILKERYARGEIDKEDFEERRKVLGD